MRIFVAIDLDEKVVERLSELQRKLHSHYYDIKIVEPDNLHLTLKFLGEVEETGRTEQIISEVAKEFHEFTLSFDGLGYFGNGNRVNVIWAGVKECSEKFVKLACKLDEKLSFIRKEDHELSPHLTIARVKSGRNVQELAREVRSLGDVKIGEVHVKEIKLKQSVLTPQGPIYSDVNVFPLKKR
jgi:2'-5' RNA ligase